MTRSIEDVIGMKIVLVPMNVGSSVIGDTIENLKSVLDKVVELVGIERDLSVQGRKYDSDSPFACGQDPYNPLRYQLHPKFWIGNGLTQEYYDQRIAIYNHVLGLVEETRGNFCSSRLCDFTGSIKQYIEQCESSKKELQKQEERSTWLRGQQAIVDRMFA